MRNIKYFLIGFALCSSTYYSKAIDINAGPIMDNKHAQKICPKICSKQNLVWNGNWLTTEFGRMSVCGCDPKNVKK